MRRVVLRNNGAFICCLNLDNAEKVEYLQIALQDSMYTAKDITDMPDKTIILTTKSEFLQRRENRKEERRKERAIGNKIEEDFLNTFNNL